MAQQIGFGFHPLCAGSLNFAQLNGSVARGHDQALFPVCAQHRAGLAAALGAPVSVVT